MERSRSWWDVSDTGYSFVQSHWTEPLGIVQFTACKLYLTRTNDSNKTISDDDKCCEENQTRYWDGGAAAGDVTWGFSKHREGPLQESIVGFPEDCAVLRRSPPGESSCKNFYHLRIPLALMV